MTAYSDVTNSNKNFASQAFRASMANEHVHYALCGTDITNMEGLIVKGQVLAKAEEVRNSRKARSQSHNQRKFDQNRNNRTKQKEVRGGRRE